MFHKKRQGQGTCFMFSCGPPQNFRCKFTKHANYTSAVFSIDKNVPSPTISSLKSVAPASTLSQHELELKNLKGKSDSR